MAAKYYLEKLLLPSYTHCCSYSKTFNKFRQITCGIHTIRSTSLSCPSNPKTINKSCEKTTDTSSELVIKGVEYKKDEWTNIQPKILSYVGRNLHLQNCHPLSLIKRRIVDFFYNKFPSKTRSPLFTSFENLHPVVSTYQNFDSLLVAPDHVSRSKTDCYYVNKDFLLRSHTSAHQSELIKMGMNNFLVVGDVYRRDAIDKNHFPVFHQLEGVRLCTKHEIFRDNDKLTEELPIFIEKDGVRTAEKQEHHTLDAVFIMTKALKSCLNDLTQELFGKDVEIRWVEAYFPFTHPSWEIEVKLDGEWLEILGCGIMEHNLLVKAGAGDKIGWAFGLGLERLAMKLYGVPDIRTFWSTDSGFLHQFLVDDPYKPITYKSVSQYPQCINDISFWLPTEDVAPFSSNDFYDLVRSVGGDIVEQVTLVDEFHHLKKKRWSHCYRIIYRHMEKTLTQEEVNRIHKLIEETVTKDLRVEIR